jgi:peptidyl-prolyl cis-trans isomerase C
VATVNGTDITVGHMIIARASLPEQYQQLPDEVLFRGILDQLIQQTALRDSFEGELPPRVSLSIENESRSLIAGEMVEVILSVPISEEDLRAAYEAEYSDASPGDEYNASHILVETEEEAQTIIEDIEGGADFAAVAREKSTGPSGPGGGNLGWFGAGAMVPDFEAAVIALEVGAVSAPVKTDFGWHVIMLNETRKLSVPQFDDVRSDLEQSVRQAKVQETVQGFVDASEVDRSGSEGVDPSILKNLDLLEK